MSKHDLLILGGGQLGRMSAQAAQKMGVTCLILDPDPNCPASSAAEVHIGEIEDPIAIAQAADRAAAVTLENEFIPAEIIRKALSSIGADSMRITPNLDALATIQDKLKQRQAYAAHNAPSPRAIELDSEQIAAETLGFPQVIKARFRGYDGKGTRTVHSAEGFAEYRLLFESSPWLAEEFVPFKRELAVMVWRTESESGAYPTMETVQSNHVCDLVFPSDVDASQVALSAVEAVGGYGLFGVELFELEDGSLLVNEIAPRPHNTGHYTLDSGGPSQFEQHVRISIGLKPAIPSGQPSAMANILGITDRIEGWQEARDETLNRFPSAHFHWYEKRESRPGRKLGHINATGKDAKTISQQARDHFYRVWSEIQSRSQS